MNLGPALLEIIVCPACPQRARRGRRHAQRLACVCGLALPVRDDIPGAPRRRGPQPDRA